MHFPGTTTYAPRGDVGPDAGEDSGDWDSADSGDGVGCAVAGTTFDTTAWSAEAFHREVNQDCGWVVPAAD